jgi:hypothetical protein
MPPVTRAPGTGTLRVKGPAKSTGTVSGPPRTTLTLTGLTPTRVVSGPGVVRQPVCGTLALTGRFVAIAFKGPSTGALLLTGLTPTRVVSGTGASVVIPVPVGRLGKQALVMAMPVGYL